MPNSTGTDLRMNNVMATLKTFVLSCGFECVADTLSGETEYSATAFQCGSVTLAGLTSRTIYFKCVGYDNNTEFYFAVYNINSGTSYYTIAVRGIANYVEGRDIDYTAGGIPYAGNPAYMPINGNTDSLYYLTGDERKIYLLNMAGTRPQMFGFGLFLPSGTTAGASIPEYRHPAFVGGSICSPTTSHGSATATTGNKCFFSPSMSSGAPVYSLVIYDPDGVWRGVYNYPNSDTIAAGISSIGDQRCVTLPYVEGWFRINYVDARAWNSDDLALFPIKIFYQESGSDRINEYGELDGVFYVSGQADVPLVPNDDITIDTTSYRIWSHPLLQDANSFCAVRMEP